jgi:hypothetical protein
LRPSEARDSWESGTARCQIKKNSSGKFHHVPITQGALTEHENADVIVYLPRLSAQELDEQLAHVLRLFLLHPMPRALDEMGAAPLRASLSSLAWCSTD